MLWLFLFGKVQIAPKSQYSTQSNESKQLIDADGFTKI